MSSGADLVKVKRRGHLLCLRCTRYRFDKAENADYTRSKVSKSLDHLSVIGLAKETDMMSTTIFLNCFALKERVFFGLQLNLVAVPAEQIRTIPVNVEVNL